MIPKACQSIQMVCHSQEVTQRVNDHRAAIHKICLSQVDKVPVIVIGQDAKYSLQKLLEHDGIRVEALWDKQFVDSNSKLGIFSLKQNGKYAVFIINETQGRGLDFMSSTEIEDNGGVYVVIATLPTAYLQYKQFLGRTARVGNKGQYCVIHNDKDSKNADGRIYLQQKLEALESQDLLRATSWLKSSESQLKTAYEEAEAIVDGDGI